MRILPYALVFALTLAGARADLAGYVALPDTEAKWTVKTRMESGNCEITQIELVSQVWQGIEWKHDLVLFRPKDAPPSNAAFLLNSGGRAKPEGIPYGVMLATKIKAPVAILLGVPNQPLFDNKREDDLIAETFVRYLDTQDDKWPLLFPMVKSLVKAMDAVQDISGAEWGKKVERFVVSGASKRGWTTWLTAASDTRVFAIAPMVIDVLNMPAQMARQVECFGEPSEQIRPYSARGLVPIKDTPEAHRLWSWVDPWTYRAKFTLPKMVVLGTNDRYWAPDALNIYWKDLPGEKWISYTPNAGHNLTETKSDGSKDPNRAVNAVAAFARYQISGRPLPKLSWNHSDENGKLHLAIDAEPAPKEVKVWRANGPTKDLREAAWASRTVEVKDGHIVVDEDRPASGVSSFFAELAYQIDDLPYSLCTQLRYVEAPTGAGK